MPNEQVEYDEQGNRIIKVRDWESLDALLQNYSQVQQAQPQLVMKQGGEVVQEPLPPNRSSGLSSEEKRAAFLRANAGNPVDKLQRQSAEYERGGYIESNPFEGMTEDEYRQLQYEGAAQKKAERDEMLRRQKIEKGDFKEEICDFLKDSPVYQKIKTKVVAPRFYESIMPFFTNTLKTFSEFFPIKVKNTLRTTKIIDFEKALGAELIKNTQLSELSKDSRACVWSIRPPDNEKRMLYIIAYDGKLSFVTKIDSVYEERFIDSVIGIDMKEDNYARQSLYEELVSSIKDVLAIEDEDGD